LQQGVDGYGGTSDTEIYQYDADNADYYYQSTVRVGYRQQHAGLLRFDLASIPSSATVTQATLQLYVGGWSGNNISFGAFAILQSWNQTEATWNTAGGGARWFSPGCSDTTYDRRANPASSVATSGINKWYSLDVTDLVQEWVNGSLFNAGMLLRQTNTVSYYVSIISADGGGTSTRPKLVITYR